MQELYAPFTRTGAPIMMMDTASAELCKYAANSMLATRISFMNEIANVCELVGADVDQVRKAIGADRRIGTSFLFPGVGYGGSCFPKDVKALLQVGAATSGYDFKILRAVEAVNDAAEGAAGRRRWTRTSATLKGRTIALWGLAFKPRTDDMREAPAIPIIERLLARGATVQRLRSGGRADGAPASSAAGSRCATRATTRSTGADALAIVTEWNEFREPDFDKMRDAAAGRRSSSTAATSIRPSRCARSASPISPLAAERARRAGHRRRRLHRQPRRQGAAPRRLSRRRLRQPGRRPSRARSSTASSSKATSPTSRPSAARCGATRSSR